MESDTKDGKVNHCCTQTQTAYKLVVVFFSFKDILLICFFVIGKHIGYIYISGGSLERGQQTTVV